MDIYGGYINEYIYIYDISYLYIYIIFSCGLYSFTMFHQLLGGPFLHPTKTVWMSNLLDVQIRSGAFFASTLASLFCLGGVLDEKRVVF